MTIAIGNRSLISFSKTRKRKSQTNAMRSPVFGQTVGAGSIPVSPRTSGSLGSQGDLLQGARSGETGGSNRTEDSLAYSPSVVSAASTPSVIKGRGVRAQGSVDIPESEPLQGAVNLVLSRDGGLYTTPAIRDQVNGISRNININHSATARTNNANRTQVHQATSQKTLAALRSTNRALQKQGVKTQQMLRASQKAQLKANQPQRVWQQNQQNPVNLLLDATLGGVGGSLGELAGQGTTGAIRGIGRRLGLIQPQLLQAEPNYLPGFLQNQPIVYQVGWGFGLLFMLAAAWKLGDAVIDRVANEIRGKNRNRD